MRQANFEILRVMAMLMIVFWHFIQNIMINHGPVYHPSPTDFINYAFLQYGMILCSVGVNLYVMITGYFMIGKSFKSNRIIRVWVQTLFYSIGIALLFYIIQPDKYTIKDVLISLIPIRAGSYWFVTDYLGLLLTAPFLSKLANSLSNTQYIKLLLVIFVIGTNFIAGYPLGDSMGGNLGYSLIWFMALFMIGAYFRLHGNDIPKHNYLKWYFIGGGLTFLYFVIRQLVKKDFSFYMLYYEDLHYNSFPIILTTLLFIWFKQHKFARNHISKTIIYIAPFTFGVYLIHSNPIISKLLWTIIYNLKESIEKETLIPLGLLSCMIIFLLCIIGDMLRNILFVTLKIDKGISYISTKIDNSIINITNKIHIQK